MKLAKIAMDYQLLQNIHEKLEPPSEAGKSFLAKDPYFYYHYKCDGNNDVVRKNLLAWKSCYLSHKLL